MPAKRINPVRAALVTYFLSPLFLYLHLYFICILLPPRGVLHDVSVCFIAVWLMLIFRQLDVGKRRISGSHGLYYLVPPFF